MGLGESELSMFSVNRNFSEIDSLPPNSTYLIVKNSHCGLLTDACESIENRPLAILIKKTKMKSAFSNINLQSKTAKAKKFEACQLVYSKNSSTRCHRRYHRYPAADDDADVSFCFGGGGGGCGCGDGDGDGGGGMMVVRLR